MSYRLWVNDDSTILVRLWETGNLEVATRDERGDTWGPPVFMAEETVVHAARPAPDPDVKYDWDRDALTQ